MNYTHPLPVVLWNSSSCVCKFQGYENKKLKNSPPMNEERIRLLEELNFKWGEVKDPNAWEAMFDELMQFKAKYGHTRVTTGKQVNTSKGSKKLHYWVGLQRQYYNQRNSGTNITLTPERIRLLDSIGFSWDPISEQWNSL